MLLLLLVLVRMELVLLVWVEVLLLLMLVELMRVQAALLLLLHSRHCCLCSIHPNDVCHVLHRLLMAQVCSLLGLLSGRIGHGHIAVRVLGVEPDVQDAGLPSVAIVHLDGLVRVNLCGKEDRAETLAPATGVESQHVSQRQAPTAHTTWTHLSRVSATSLRKTVPHLRKRSLRSCQRTRNGSCGQSIGRPQKQRSP
jgi:hypothetical protein